MDAFDRQTKSPAIDASCFKTKCNTFDVWLTLGFDFGQKIGLVGWFLSPNSRPNPLRFPCIYTQTDYYFCLSSDLRALH